MKDALLIIDMQNGCFQTPRFDKDGVIERINMISSKFREKGNDIIFIQHNGIKENYLLPGTSDFDVVKELETMKTDFQVTKKVNSAFYESDLDKLLQSKNIDTLYISGLATDFCVNATIHSALLKNYNIVVVSDCHTTADKPMICAKDIIEYHNMLWSNLTPTKGSIKIKNHKEVIEAQITV